MNFQTRTAKLIVGGVAAIASFGLLAPHAVAATSHCDGHDEAAKIQSEGTTVVNVPVINGGDLGGGGTLPGDPEPSDTTMDISVTVVGESILIEGDGIVDVSWCIKSSTESTDGTGLTGTSGIFNKKGVEQDVSYIVIYSVTTDLFGGDDLLTFDGGDLLDGGDIFDSTRP